MADPPSLIETADAAAPMGAEAAWFTGAGGAKLRAALFTPPGRARGSIVLSGGRTETIEKYYEFIGECLERGFVVLAHDWRGQGLSHRDLPDRMKSYAKGYRAFVDDFRLMLDAYQQRLPKPWVAVGHSMGGCLTLLSLALGEQRFAGAVLSAPMLGVITGNTPPSIARALARMNSLTGSGKRYVGRRAPRPSEGFEGNALTHDRVRFERNARLIEAEPKLALAGPTWGWLDFAFRATTLLAQPERLRAITIPVVIVAAEQDSLVDNAAQAAAARNLPQGQYITVPGAFHEILMETDPMRNIFLRAFDALTGRTAPKASEPPKAVEPTPPQPVVAAAPVAPPAPAAAAPKPAVAKAAPAKKPAAAKKPAKAAAKAPAAKAKPAAAKAAPAKAPVAKKPVAKKPAAKKPAAKAAPANKVAAPKTVAATPKAAVKKAPARTAAVKTPAAKPKAAMTSTAAAKPKAAAAKKKV